MVANFSFFLSPLLSRAQLRYNLLLLGPLTIDWPQDFNLKQAFPTACLSRFVLPTALRYTYLYSPPSCSPSSCLQSQTLSFTLLYILQSPAVWHFLCLVSLAEL